MNHIFSILIILVLSVLSVSAQTENNSYKNFTDTAFIIGDKIPAPSIYFEFDGSSLVRKESYNAVKVIANFLIKHPNLMIEIGVHSDSRGSDDYNRRISQIKSENVKNVLVLEFGISKDRIANRGYGESQPLEDCSLYIECAHDESVEGICIIDCPCHQRNRRVELKIIEL
ncbi:MAG: OmpA family protein [Bacteroidetes bacterium]|nr:OmpA family protein [Bacteroidota bacterium]